jgi:hypothetical protein
MNRAKLVRMRALFSGASVYRCDAPGRSFAWGPPEFVQLMLDIEDGARTPPERNTPKERLYLGVVHATRSLRGPATVNDGRQRLMALSMVLAFARDRSWDPHEQRRLNAMLFRTNWRREAEPRLQLGPDEQPWFERRILAPGATMKIQSDAPAGGIRQLLYGARFLYRAFDAYTDQQRRELAAFVANHTAVVLSNTPEHVTTPCVKLIAPPHPAPYAQLQHEPVRAPAA